MRALLAMVIAICWLCPNTLLGQLILRLQVGLGLATQTYFVDGSPFRDENLRVSPRPVVEVEAALSYFLEDEFALMGGLWGHNRGSRRAFQYDYDEGFQKIIAKFGLSYLEWQASWP